jgi:peptidoglycan/LPS O-acetylase OafA/YrhL
VVGGPVDTAPTARDSARAHKKAFRKEIQGIRALGLFIVFLTHAEFSIVPGGFVGLDAFFVLSGFLITGLIVKEMEKTGRLSLTAFYGRRIRRLLPLAMFVLLAVVVGSALLFSPVRNETVAGDVLGASLYFVNWRFAAQSIDYFAVDPFDSPLQHFWSLSVEEQFYLVWPVLLLAAFTWWSRNREARSLRRALWTVMALLGIPSFVYSAFVIDANAYYSYFSTLTRVWEFAVGGALALALPAVLRLPRGLGAALAWAGIATLLVTAALYSPATPYPGTAALAPVLATVAIIVAGTATKLSAPIRALSSRPAQYVGDLSYAWYLWHWPMLVFAREIWGPITPPRAMLVIAAAWVPTAISHALIEQPFRYSRPLARRPRRALAFGAASMAVAVVAATALEATQPRVVTAANGQVIGAKAAERGQALQHRATALKPPPTEAKEDRGRLYEDGCLVEGEVLESPECVYGDPDSDTTVVLFGNSHAMHYFPALERIAKRRGWRLVGLTRAGCRIADVRFASRCDIWRERTLRRIEEVERPDLIVTATTTGGTYGVVKDDKRLDPEESHGPLEEGLVRTFDRLSSTGARVAVIKDLPRSRGDVPECVSEALDRLEQCAFWDERGRTRHFDARAAERVDGAEVIDPAPLVCPKRLCPAVMGNALVYRDDNHFTATFAGTLAPWIERQLENVEPSV